MRASIRIFFSVLISFGLSQCILKSYFFRSPWKQKNVPEQTDSETIKILNVRTIGITDTLMAYARGKIFGRDSINPKDTLKLLNTDVLFVHRERKDTLSGKTDENGVYEKCLPAGTYHLIFKHPGHVKFVIENVPFRIGEIRELDVLLVRQKSMYVESKKK